MTGGKAEDRRETTIRWSWQLRLEMRSRLLRLEMRSACLHINSTTFKLVQRPWSKIVEKTTTKVVESICTGKRADLTISHCPPGHCNLRIPACLIAHLVRPRIFLFSAPVNYLQIAALQYLPPSCSQWPSICSVTILPLFVLPLFVHNNYKSSWLFASIPNIEVRNVCFWRSSGSQTTP